MCVSVYLWVCIFVYGKGIKELFLKKTSELSVEEENFRKLSREVGDTGAFQVKKEAN